MALATEVLIASQPVRSMIRESKAHQIYSVIQTSQKEGMKTMNQSLADLYTSGTIALDECLRKTMNIDEFERLIKPRGIQR